jgi:hypothetical protein
MFPEDYFSLSLGKVYIGMVIHAFGKLTNKHGEIRCLPEVFELTSPFGALFVYQIPCVS